MVRNCEPSKMETTFYDEQAYHHTNVNQLKRNLTLDLGQTKIAMKKQKMDNNNSPLLSTPDLNMLKVRTPELDTLVLLTQQNGEVPATPTQLLFPKVVTEAQEAYVRGFEHALYELQQSDSSQGLQSVDLPVTTATSINTTLSGGCTTYTDLDQPDLRSFQMKGGYLDNVVIKDEPQIVPSMGTSPPLSPIDMECQERIKLERKRQRNRVAASKCRRRKLERISKLEEKVKQLKGENAELSGIVSKLRAQVVHLKQQVMDHVNAGCPIINY